MIHYVQVMNNNLVSKTAKNQESRTSTTEFILPLHNDEAFLKETKSMLDLRALEEIEKNPKISQRELSSHLGVALGITNALLKSLTRRGLVKIRGANNRSLTYHLTHIGVVAKSRLTVRWTLNTIEFYRQARWNIADRLKTFSREGVESALLYGIGELTEIAVIVASEAGLKIDGIIDDKAAHEGRKLLAIPIMRLDQVGAEKPDAIIICVKVDDTQVEELNKHVMPGTRVYSLI